MWIASLVAAVAAAADRAPCAPMDEAELRSYVLDAQSAIDRGDVEVPAAILAEVDSRLACLTFVVPSRMWAELLVARAIVEFSRGGDWQSAMAGAVRIRPSIDRGVGSGHPLYRWEPPGAPAGGAPVPEGARLYVDGQPSPVLPPDQGLYLVQKTDVEGRYVNTLLLHDEALPADWVRSPVELPPRIGSWGRIGLTAGGATVIQQPSWVSDVYPFDELQGAVLGGTADLQLTFFSPFGLLAHADLGWLEAPLADGRVAAIWAWRGVTLGGGVGRNTVMLTESVYGPTAPTVTRQLEVLQYGHLTTLLRSGSSRFGRAREGGAIRYDLGGTIGTSGAATVLEATLGMVLPVGGERYRVGVWMDRRDGAFFQQGLREREVVTSSFSLALSLEWVRGEY